MFGLFISVGLLGLLAIDPIGIAAMPILLTQKSPFVRSFMFLGGSFVALLAMGLLFALGLGAKVLHLESTQTWLVPGIELLAGLGLLIIAGMLLWRFKTGRLPAEPSDNLTERLHLSYRRLFVLGAVIVALQSVADVVFVIAMVRIGQLHLETMTLTAAVAIYATTALILQLAVVVAYRITPQRERIKTLGRVHKLLARYANQTLIGVSLVLGCALLANSCLAITGAPHL